MTADTREVIAKIVDPIAMMTFEEEVERLHRELSKAIPSLTKDDPSLLGLARDNIAESFDDRNAALAKADQIIAALPALALVPGWRERYVAASALLNEAYGLLGELVGPISPSSRWTRVQAPRPLTGTIRRALSLRERILASPALTASPALPETKSPDQGEGS